MTRSGIKVQPKDIWQYFVSNAIRLESSLLCVAENDDEGEVWGVWLTSDDGAPVFQVFYGDESIREYTAFGEDDIQEAYGYALGDIGYMTLDDDRGLPTASYSNEADDEDADYDIMVRESELDEICKRLIIEILDAEHDAASLDDDTIAEATKTIKEVVCDILGKQYGLDVYRPMHLVAEDGTQFFTEHPYPSIMAAEKAERDRNRIKE